MRRVLNDLINDMMIEYLNIEEIAQNFPSKYHLKHVILPYFRPNI